MRPQPAMIENIRLRVSTEEKAALRIAASRRGLTLSEYIRETVATLLGELPRDRYFHTSDDGHEPE